MKITPSTTFYTHNKKGKKYAILNLCQYQHNNIWYDAIAYRDVETNKIYVRSEESFNDSFKVVEG